MSFDTLFIERFNQERSFNPFGTGQCLSTEEYCLEVMPKLFQSLWNRAMSFDKTF